MVDVDYSNQYRTAIKIYAMFIEYGKTDDFVGMDMARKFLKWVLHVRGATQITKVGENIVAPEPFFPKKKIGKIQKKPSLQRFFLSTTQKQKVTQPILS